MTAKPSANAARPTDEIVDVLIIGAGASGAAVAWSLAETDATANEWFSHTLYSRLNDKRTGAIVIIMQRLHEDDLVGHVLAQEPWEVLSFPATAEEDEVHKIETILGPRTFTRRRGEALHPEREPLETLDRTTNDERPAWVSVE